MSISEKKDKRDDEGPGEWGQNDDLDDQFFGFKESFFRGFDEQFRRMSAQMDSMIDKAERGEIDNERNGVPFVYGWSMRVGPDGIPHIQKFGNTSRMPGFGTSRTVNELSAGASGDDSRGQSCEGASPEGCQSCGSDDVAGPGVREPLTDIGEDEKNIIITAEMPGIDRDSIELETGDEHLTIKVAKGNRQYYKEVELSSKVRPNTARARYNNGVLVITVEKAPFDRKAATKVKVD